MGCLTSEPKITPRTTFSAVRPANRPRRTRSQLRHAGWLVLAPLLGTVACWNWEEVVDGPVGFVSVTITGLQPGFTSAGRATITGATITDSITIDLPADTTGSAEVPVGTYHVVYEPPTGYALTEGSSGETDVTVVAADTTDVSFTVVEEPGTLTITVAGIDVSAADGGSAEVQRSDIGGQAPVTVPIPSEGSVDTAVSPGTYSVTYTPPANHVLAAGATNPQSITVPANGSGVATFEIEFSPPVGTLEVTVTGLSQSAGNGGSVEAERTDVGGQAPITIAIPSDGSVDSVVPAGTYSVTYSAPAAHQLAAGETNPQSVTVPDGGVGSVSFDVDTVTAPTGAVFHSDWSTALGSTEDALRDTGQDAPWDQIIGNGTGAVVVSSTGLNIPSSNALEVTANDIGGGTGRGGAQIPRVTNAGAHIPVPQVGESLYYRWYIRVTTPDAYTSDDQTHPFQDGNNIGASNWALVVITNTNGTFVARFDVDATPANAWPNTHFGNNIVLTKGETYRYEMQIARIGATEFNMHARIYDAAGTLLYDDGDFMNANGSASLADTPTLVFNNVDNLAGLNSGINGLDTGQPELYPITMYYQAAVCVRTDDWCGPYAGGI